MGTIWRWSLLIARHRKLKIAFVIKLSFILIVFGILVVGFASNRCWSHFMLTYKHFYILLRQISTVFHHKITTSYRSYFYFVLQKLIFVPAIPCLKCFKMIKVLFMSKAGWDSNSRFSLVFIWTFFHSGRENKAWLDELCFIDICWWIDFARMWQYVRRCAIWYHFYNFYKTHERVLLLLKILPLHGCLNCTNVSKSRKASHIMILKSMAMQK